MPDKTKAPAKTQPAKQPKPEAKDLGYKLISTDLIDDPEAPVRSDLTPAGVESLVLSIKQVGIIEPLVVKPSKGRYEVIAGHRRLYSAKLAKIPEVPCFVREANMEQTEMLKIHENLYREDIKPADEAKHFDYLIQKQGMSPHRIAQLISKSDSYVNDRLAILNYPPFLRQAMDDKEITFSVAREFAKFGDEDQMRHAVFYAKRSGMTSDMARKWVLEWKEDQNRQHGKQTSSPDDTGDVKEIEHTATCVYCRKPLRLREAEVVYMHNHCLKQAKAVTLEHERESNNQAQKQSPGQTSIPTA